MGIIEESKDANNGEVGLTPTPEEAPGSRDNFGDDELLPFAVSSNIYMDGQSLSFGTSEDIHRNSNEWSYIIGQSEITRYAESMGFLPDDEIIADVTHAREITSSDLHSF
jgi:hypothetical protein